MVLAAAGLTVGAAALLALGLVGVLPFAATTADVHFGDVSMAWWLPVLGLGVVTAALAYVTGIAATLGVDWSGRSIAAAADHAETFRAAAAAGGD